MAFSQKTLISFQRAHRSILLSLDRIQGVSRLYSQAKLGVCQLNDHVLNHLSRQDETFYQSLRDFYASHRESLKMLEFLTHDLKDLKIKYLVFSEKHSGAMGDLGARSFIKDFGEFKQDLVERIEMEENYLFPLLDGVIRSMDQGS